MILAGDIGGTKVNLAYFDAPHGELDLLQDRSYPSREFRSLEDVLAAMLREYPTTVTSAAFGIAGPIVNNRSKLTNLGWDVDGEAVSRSLRLQRVGLLNDLAATAYGTLHVRPEEKVILQKGERQEYGAVAVLAAGTGLGEGGLIWDGRRYRALPSEGGHTDFAPRNEMEIDLLRFLLTRYERVSYERIVAGPGFQHLYDFFRSRADYPEPAWLRNEMQSGDPSAVISRAGMEKTDAVCEHAVAAFVSLYGAEAGNLALKFLATGGVCVAGGITPKILSRIQDGSFLASFVHKGRYTSLMQRMPVEVILNEKTALLGAAHYALLMQEGAV